MGNRLSGDVGLFTRWPHRIEFPGLTAAVVAAALEAAGCQRIGDHESRDVHLAYPDWSRRHRGEGSAVRRLARTRFRPARPWPRSAC